MAKLVQPHQLAVNEELLYIPFCGVAFDHPFISG